MKSKKIFSLILFLFSSASFAGDDACNVLSGINNKSADDITNLATNCSFAKNLVQNEEIQTEHLRRVYEKMADKLAYQIRKNSKDLSMLDRYYTSLDQSLLMNSPNVGKDCSLIQNLNGVELCKGKGGAFQKEKLAMLKKSLAPKNKANKENKTISELMSDIYSQDYLGRQSINEPLACPLVEKNGDSYILSSQMTNVTADLIIETIKKSVSKKNTKFLDRIFDQYPQLKLIQQSSPELKKKFIEYAANMPASEKSNVFISNFFKDSKNQEFLEVGLASSCTSITKNLQTYLCDSIQSPAISMNPDISEQIFDGYSGRTDTIEAKPIGKDNFPVSYVAYGTMCIAREKNVTAKSLENNISSVDSWFNQFTKNAKVIEDEEEDLRTVQNFCSQYKCETESAKLTLSCKNGGPISYTDVSSIYKCGNPDLPAFPLDSRDELCSESAIKSIFYMKGLAKSQSVAEGNLNETDSSDNSSTPSDGKRKKFSAFYEALLGPKESLKKLNLPVTPEAIAEREVENSKHTLTQQSPTTAPAAIKQSKQAGTEAQTQQTVAAGISPQYNPTRAISSPAITNPSKRIEEKAVSLAPGSKSNVLGKEEQDTRRQLEELLNQLKDEKGTTKKDISVNDEKIAKAKAASTAGPDQYLLAEKERLKNRALELDDRERKLRDEYKALDEKIASRMEAAASVGGVAAPAAQGISSGGESGKAANKEAAPALLTANKGEQKPNTAAMIQSDKESKPISTEELATLSSDGLKQLGINTDLPFTLRVNFDNKVHEVQVKSISDNGKSVLAPVLNPKEKKLKAFLLKTTLFKPYVEYRLKNGGSLVDSF